MKLSRSIVFSFGSSIITTGLLLLCGGGVATAQAQQCPPLAANNQCYLQLDCHCFGRDVDGDNVPDCPDIEERQFLIDLFQNNQQLINDWKDMTPIPNSLPTLDCQPYEKVANAIPGEKYCGNHPDDNDKEEGYCAFLCAGESGMYKLQTLPNLNAVGKGGGKKRKKVLTHHGACGVCSSAQDLAAFVNPLIALLTIACGQNFDVNDGDLDGVTQCLVTRLGFTYDCAYLWASNTVNSILAECQPICLETYGQCLDILEQDPEEASKCFGSIPSNVQTSPNTCELNGCICCDNKASGETFNYYSGRTRRNSGILTTAEIPFPVPAGLYVGLKRDCDSIPNVAQLGAFCD